MASVMLSPVVSGEGLWGLSRQEGWIGQRRGVFRVSDLAWRGKAPYFVW